MDPQDFEFDSPKVEQWLSYTLGLPEQAFVSLSGLEGALFDPLDQSRSGMDYFLKEDFLPHQNRSLNARWSAHAASSEEGIDLLRAFFESGDLNFRLFEGRNFLLLQVAADDREHAFRDGRRAYVGRLIDRVVVTSMFSHTWEIRLPVETNDMSHSFVVTNEGAPGVDEIHDRNDRIDVLINSYQTAFLFYKKVGQRVLFMPGHEWFSDDARTLILGNQTQ